MTEDQYWWASVHGHDNPEIVEVTFENGKPRRVDLIGTDNYILAPDFEWCKVRLIERVLPAGRAAAAVEKLTEPQDAFGAHVTEGTLGRIGDREIGPGHVVLSEARYRWLFERAGLPVENLPSASA